MSLGFTISGTTHDGIYMDVQHRNGVATYGTPTTCHWLVGYGTDSAANKGDNCKTTYGNTAPAYGHGDAEANAALRTFEFASNSAEAGSYLATPLYLAAKYGGYNDSNRNGKPDPGEWEGPDGAPRNYFKATNISELPSKLEAAFNDIARSVSTGTATSASVNSVLGAGVSIQTAFYPMYVSPKDPTKIVNWVGTVYALFVDRFGNLRQDDGSTPNVLDSLDTVVTFNSVADPPNPLPDCYQSGSPISRCRVDSYGNIDSASVTGLRSIHELTPLWDAGELLVQRDPASRTIYYVDPADSTRRNFVSNVPEEVNRLSKYLLYPNWSSLVPAASKAQAVQKLIEYTRGTDYPDLRSRAMDDPWENKPEGITWRLGDIINSKPIIVGQPAFNYDHLYSDNSYAAFKSQRAARRQVAYFGSNDGLIHAINMGNFGSLTDGQAGFKPASGEKLGQELWAMIPGSLLPHLQWLADPSYIHSYYVDMKPLVADIRKQDGTWRTILICGLRLGGRPIESPIDADGNKTIFYSEFMALDVTDPEMPPEVLWRFSAEDMGLSVGLPAVVTSSGKWYVVLASGPATDFANSAGQLIFGKSPYDGVSTQKAKLIILNAENGQRLKTLEVPEANSFFNEPFVPVSLRRTSSGTWNDESIYYGMTVSRDAACLDKGAVYRLKMIESPNMASGELGGSPLPVSQWELKRFVSVDRPVTGAVNSAFDSKGNLWVTFTTGRMWGLEDIVPCAKTDTPACRENHLQYLFGIKEPLYKGRMTYAERLDLSSLVDVSGGTVWTKGGVSGITGITSYTGLTELLRSAAMPGYKRQLNMSTILYGTTPSAEIGVSQPQITSLGIDRSVIGFTSYEPTVGQCGDYGQGFMYVLDPFTGLPAPYLAGAFKVDTISAPGPMGVGIPGGISTGHGQPSGAIFVVLGDQVIVRTSTTENSIFDVPLANDNKLVRNIITWREVFNTGFSLPKDIMSGDINLAP
jgi:type IV pilus assembly protein PilY1